MIYNNLTSAQSSDPKCVYVLHAHEHAADFALQGLQLLGIKLITGMADFADCHGTVACLWIDARMTWRFPGYSLFSMLQPGRDLQVFIYNCEHLAPELLTLNHPQLQFVKGNIHLDLLVSSQNCHITDNL